MKACHIGSLFILLSFINATEQKNCGTPSREVIFVDTVEIPDPIVLGFIEPRTDGRMKRLGTLLVRRCEADTTELMNGVHGYSKCLTSIGYQFELPSLFTCYISNALHNNPDVSDADLLKSLKSAMLRASSDPVWVEDYYFRHKYVPVYYRGFESFAIRQRRFWLFLVKNSATLDCTSDEELRIDDNEHLYIRVLVPITR